MAQDPGRLNVPSGGNGMPPELIAALTAGLASTGGPGGPAAQKNVNIVPLWRVRPKVTSERVNPGEFGDDASGGPRRITIQYPGGESYTPDYAASSWLDMDDAERADFERMAIASGLVKPGADPDQLASAWQRAVGYSANYNQDREESKWLSPWEAVDRLAAEQAAREGGSYDPFKPRTTNQSHTTQRDFTAGQDAEGVTRALESLFNSEMGRAPTPEERRVYQRLVQEAYNASPEKTESTTTTDANGNSTTESVQSGGIDEAATLLDRVREDPETQAFDVGSTFFEAAMGALGAIA